jgi:hypothetical protein
MPQMKVKPTSNPSLPTIFTFTGADGNTQTARLGRGITGKEFDARVNEHGDQWVMVNGTVQLGGVGPSGIVTATRTDAFGNLWQAIPSAQFGTTPQNSTSTAYEASRFVKATSGTLLGLSGYNSKASAQFILVVDYGAATVPATATVPAVIIAVAASSNFSYDPGTYGRAFSAGIWVVNSSTGPTVTVGSADCWFDVQYV